MVALPGLLLLRGGQLTVVQGEKEGCGTGGRGPGRGAAAPGAVGRGGVGMGGENGALLKVRVDGDWETEGTGAGMRGLGVMSLGELTLLSSTFVCRTALHAQDEMLARNVALVNHFLQDKCR